LREEIKSGMLTIIHTESSMGWGGQEIRIVQEALGMMKRGHRLIIAARPGSVILGKARDAGIKTVTAGFIKKNPLSILEMRSVINREKPDILNTHSSPDSWVASLAVIVSKTRPRIIRTRHLSTPIKRTIISRFIYGKVPDLVMTTGEEIRNMLVRENLCNAAKVFSVPTGVDTDRFDPAKVSPVISREGIAIGMAGVLRSWKGHNYLLAAAPEILEKVPSAHFYFVGEGPQRKYIESAIKEMGLQQKVTMLGHRDDMPEVFASLDIVAHPSFGNEGVPQTVLQAFAMEKPVVASSVGAIPEIVIDGRTGLLIEPRRPDLIAQAIIRLCNDETLRTRLAGEARKFALAGYSFSHMLDSIESIYDRILRHD
jgi:glycosyltransferase involved in cell wall biosynthesis